MTTPIHFHATTTATAEQCVAGLTDFGPGRAELFGNSADDDLEVHSVGTTEADVTEGSGGVWERLHYDWSDPKRVVLTTTDSNVWGGDSGHTYTFTRNPDGTTDIDYVVVREGKNVKGRLLGLSAPDGRQEPLGDGVRKQRQGDRGPQLRADDSRPTHPDNDDRLLTHPSTRIRQGGEINVSDTRSHRQPQTAPQQVLVSAVVADRRRPRGLSVPLVVVTMSTFNATYENTTLDLRLGSSSTRQHNPTEVDMSTTAPAGQRIWSKRPATFCMCASSAEISSRVAGDRRAAWRVMTAKVS
jgi:hypothetical protein